MEYASDETIDKNCDCAISEQYNDWPIMWIWITLT